MQGWNTRTLILMLALLILVPPLTEAWLLNREFNRSERNSELSARYECRPFMRTYRIDFNGDGMSEFLLVERLPGSSERWLAVVDDAGRALLRLPFIDGDTEKGTHVGVSHDTGVAHLLVYDAVNYHQPLRAVYAFDGRALSEIPPTAGELETLSAFAARDGRDDWRESRSMLSDSFLKLVSYYFALGVVIFSFIYRRRGGRGDHFQSLKGHP